MTTYRFTREQITKLLTSAIDMFVELGDKDYAVAEMLDGLDADREFVANYPTEYLHLQLPE